MSPFQSPIPSLKIVLLVSSLLLPTVTQADFAILFDQAVLVKQNPESTDQNVEDVDDGDDEGGEGDGSGSGGGGNNDDDDAGKASYVSTGGWAVTGADFIDAATVVFGFGQTTSVSQATLRLPIREIFPQNGFAPVSISFFADDGVIEFDDLGIGFVEPLASIEAAGLTEIVLDVTGAVNAALQSTGFIGFRVTSDVEPGSVESDLFPAYTGVRLNTNPSLEYTPGAAPIPASDATAFDGYTLNVPAMDAGSVGEVAATFQLVEPNELTFQLTAASVVSAGGSTPDFSGLELLDCDAFSAPEVVGVAEGVASYSLSSGVLDIPSVNLNGKQVAMRLEYIEGTNPWLFETLSVTTVQSGPSGSTVSDLAGGLLVEPAQDFVPLCHGWVLVGDFIRNRIVERNLITGETGAVYQFNTSPGRFILDEANGVVHFTVHPVSERIYTLDLATGDIEHDLISYTFDNGLGFQYTYGYSLRWLALGENGNIFSVMLDGEGVDPERNIPFTDTQLWLGLFDPDGNFLSPPIPLEEPIRVEYEPVQDRVFLTTQSNLATFHYDPGTHALSFVEGTDVAVGTSCTDFTFSPDGNRLAYTCPNGNYPEDPEPSIADMDPDNYYNNDGEWYFGSAPVSATFNQDGTLLVGVDNEKLYVFDVVTHLILEDYDLGLLEGETVRKVRFSKDGELIYLMLDNDNHIDNSKFYWMPTPNITGTPL
jgi:hypothetical protein